MATKKEFSVGRLFLQIALGTLLIVVEFGQSQETVILELQH